MVACLGALGERRIAGAEGEAEAEAPRQRSERASRAEVLAAAAVTVVLATGNRVLYKLALVPLKEYPFFLAQLATFGCAARHDLTDFLFLSVSFNGCLIGSVPSRGFAVGCFMLLSRFLLVRLHKTPACSLVYNLICFL